MFVRYATWAISLGFLAPGIGHARGDDLDQPPINYAKAPADNAVSRLQKDLAAGKAKLKAGEFGYLESLLAALDVPKSSQVLIFSKTSFQRHRIGPKTPRAVYFNDEV